MTTAQDQQSRYPAEFETWARDRGLISSSHGLTTEWSSLGVALEAWQAARALPAGTEPAARVIHREIPAGHGTEPSRTFDVQWLGMDPFEWVGDLYTAAQVQAMLAQSDMGIPISAPLPPGWQAVPVEPTEEMLLAGYDAQGGYANQGMQMAYRALLAAAPRPPAAQERCPHCDDTGDVHGQDGEWRGVCTCPAGKGATLEQLNEINGLAQPYGYLVGNLPNGNMEVQRTPPTFAQSVCNNCAPVYTMPPRPAAQERKPLTDEQISDMRGADLGALNFVTLREFRAIARAIEAAHGIKPAP